jgi:hypothetical protein
MSQERFRCQDPQNIFGILQKNRSEQVVSHVHVPDLVITNPRNLALNPVDPRAPSWFINKVTAVTNENPLRRNCWLEKFDKCWVIKLGFDEKWANQDYAWPGQVLIDSDGTFIYWTFQNMNFYTDGRLKMKKIGSEYTLHFYLEHYNQWTGHGKYSDGDYNFSVFHRKHYDKDTRWNMSDLVFSKPLVEITGLDSQGQEQKFLVQVD